MMEHLFTSDEDEVDEELPSHKKIMVIPSPTKLVHNSDKNNETSHGTIGSVGSVGSDEVSNSQSWESKSAIALPAHKKCRVITSPTKLVIKSDSNNKTLPGVIGYVGSGGSDEVSTSQSLESRSVVADAGDDLSMSYHSESSGHTRDLGRKDKTNGSVTSGPIVQDDMDPTKGAVAALITGAISSNGDLNALFDGGKVECMAGQVIMEDEAGGTTRCQMFWEEYYPILQVQRVVWYSNLCKDNSMGVPRIVFYVTDGLDEMPMMASTRKHSLLASFWDKKGPYETGVLRQGKIFKLIDYHMGLKKNPNSGQMVPCIFVEKVRPQPKRNMKKFRTIRAFVKEKIFK
jgi:hypothetical protein